MNKDTIENIEKKWPNYAQTMAQKAANASVPS